LTIRVGMALLDLQGCVDEGDGPDDDGGPHAAQRESQGDALQLDAPVRDVDRAQRNGRADRDDERKRDAPRSSHARPARQSRATTSTTTRIRPRPRTQPANPSGTGPMPPIEAPPG